MGIPLFCQAGCLPPRYRIISVAGISREFGVQRRKGSVGRIRIIGGRWRGRFIAVPAVPGLRPTPDRLRETVFNWLQSRIVGSRCLDLFAGTGALGLEAASRGAAEVILVERDRRAVASMAASVEVLQADNVTLVRADAITLLNKASPPFDFVFLDPPFGHGTVAICLDALVSGGWVNPESWVYSETEPTIAGLALPSGWETSRRTRVGDTEGRILRYANATAQG
jgi:16S rRNA (guanine966-N2)-methyltransferase